MHHKKLRKQKKCPICSIEQDGAVFRHCGECGREVCYYCISEDHDGACDECIMAGLRLLALERKQKRSS